MARIEPEPQQFDPEAFDDQAHQQAFREGIEAFDAGRYHLAHEAFERCWLANESGDAEFYKGLVQASICMHHLSRGNLAGARPLNVGARRLLGPFLPAHQGLDLSRLLVELQTALRPSAEDADGESPLPPPRMGPLL